MPDQDEQQEDKPFVVRVGPVEVDIPRTVGFYGGLAVAVAMEIVAPELALFIAAVPLMKLLKRKRASKLERVAAAVVEGAAKPVGGDAEATLRPAWLDDEQQKKEEEERRGNEQLRRASNGGSERSNAAE